MYFPKGTTLHPQGFPTCPKSTLEQVGPKSCPKGSAAGPVGHALGVVAFGGERVEESTTIESFYAPGGDIEFFTVGHSPASLEILTTGHYVEPRRHGRLRPRADERNPADLDGSRCALRRRPVDPGQGGFGTDGGRQARLLRHHPQAVPPSGSFSIKTEVIFDEGGANPPVPEPVTVGFKAPCPRK